MMVGFVDVGERDGEEDGKWWIWPPFMERLEEEEALGEGYCGGDGIEFSGVGFKKAVCRFPCWTPLELCELYKMDLTNISLNSNLILSFTLKMVKLDFYFESYNNNYINSSILFTYFIFLLHKFILVISFHFLTLIFLQNYPHFSCVITKTALLT